MGKGFEFTSFDDEAADIYLNLLDPAERKGKGAPAAPSDDDAPPPPDAPAEGGQPQPQVATEAAERMEVQ